MEGGGDSRLVEGCEQCGGGRSKTSQGAMTSLGSWSKVLALGLVGSRRGEESWDQTNQTLTASPWTPFVVCSVV